jgi:hypothetical protein
LDCESLAAGHNFVSSKPSEMKTLTIIIIVILALQSNMLLAAGSRPVTHYSGTSSDTGLEYLSPEIPMEATFEEASLVIDYSALAPSIPLTACFSEPAAGISPMLNLAPVLPKTADFQDTVNTDDYRYLAPVVPAAADFE